VASRKAGLAGTELLTAASGKMLLLHKLLPKLRREGHKGAALFASRMLLPLFETCAPFSCGIQCAVMPHKALCLFHAASNAVSCLMYATFSQRQEARRGVACQLPSLPAILSGWLQHQPWARRRTTCQLPYCFRWLVNQTCVYGVQPSSCAEGRPAPAQCSSSASSRACWTSWRTT